MGDRKITVEGLEVVKIDVERSLVLVRGAVPGAAGSLVKIEHHHSAENAKGE
jgi:large subunit ribosomal protein L3